MNSTKTWVHDMSDMAEHHKGQEVRIVFLFDALTIYPLSLSSHHGEVDKTDWCVLRGSRSTGGIVSSGACVWKSTEDVLFYFYFCYRVVWSLTFCNCADFPVMYLLYVSYLSSRLGGREATEVCFFRPVPK